MTAQKCFGWLGCGLVLSVGLVALPAAVSQEKDAAVRAKLQELRAKDSEGYAHLYYDAKTFLALPPARQQAIRELHRQLQVQSPGQRDRLKETMQQYVAWLEHLPLGERKQIEQADQSNRLHIIYALREKEWLATQPRAIRERIAKMPTNRLAPAAAAASALANLATPWHIKNLAAIEVFEAEWIDQRAETIKRLKQEETRKNREWVIAKRFWDELTKETVMPTHALQFSPQVDVFVREYLRPVLSKEETEALAAAEGHWPQYPMTLVQLADRHPLALPTKFGPTKVNQLPAGIKKHLEAGIDLKKGKFTLDVLIKTRMRDVEKRLEAAGVHGTSFSTKFVATVVTLAHASGIRLTDDSVKYADLWPTRYEELSSEMQNFMKMKGPFFLRLSDDEKVALARAELHWPEYPLKIAELAQRHGEQPPWHTLPTVPGALKPYQWDDYRVIAR